LISVSCDFISSFIGNEIIISGNKKEEKLVYKIAESEKLDLENEFEGGEKIMNELKEVKSQLTEIRKILKERKDIYLK
ncbi:MAG: hypothetical protein M1155_02790, partial [Patescibacteria group bacterium]|nr:hypothetical protein [Patescibacteria group bacterium]